MKCFLKGLKEIKYVHVILTTPAKFNGQFKFYSKCPMFSTYKLCAHTVDDMHNLLTEYFLKACDVFIHHDSELMYSGLWEGV